MTFPEFKEQKPPGTDEPALSPAEGSPSPILRNPEDPKDDLPRPGEKRPTPSFKDLVANLPHHPGVYLMKDGQERILYIGKAKDLKKRVSSYLKGDDLKTTILLGKVEQLDYILTANEKEALILESNLIKKHRPRYNVDLKDDKRYPCLRLGLDEAFPRLQVVRRIQKDRALYFGPFSSAGKMRATLAYLKRLFPLRQCRQKELPRRSRACLYHQTGRCPAPCQGLISREEYNRRVEEVVAFLEGRKRDLVKELKRRMMEAAEELRFEEAAVLRDRLQAVSETLKEQKVVSSRFVDLDVLAVAEGDKGAAVVILFVRLGSVTGLAKFRFKDPAQGREELLVDLIQQYYRGGRYIPRTLLIPFPLEEQPLLEEILSEMKGGPVRLQVPRKGEGLRWMAMAEENVLSLLEKKGPDQEYLGKTAPLLKDTLGLSKTPLTVGGLDISNLAGGQAVGSFVLFREGREDKNGYRRFKIRTRSQPDDYAMMAEVMERLLSRYPQLPDVLLVDGGKGQLNILKHLVERLPPQGRPDILALAKHTFLNQGGRDGIYLPNRKNPVLLPQDSPVLLFLQRVRDEAHRFALSYHHLLRKKERLLIRICV
jgi:excinuclease ABC subunit C